MAKKWLSVESVDIESRIHGGIVIPKKVVEVKANKIADYAKRKIVERTKEGSLLSEGRNRLIKKKYSTAGARIPLEKVGDRSVTRTRRYNQMVAPLRKSRDVRESENGVPFAYFPGGYASFRAKVPGVPPGRNINLSFTGRLIEDFEVEPRLIRLEDLSGAKKRGTSALLRSGGKIGGSNPSVESGEINLEAYISLEFGFTTQSSWRIARNQEDRGNRFAGLTPRERLDVQRFARKEFEGSRKFMEGLMRNSKVDVPTGPQERHEWIPRDNKGRFIRIR